MFIPNEASLLGMGSLLPGPKPPCRALRKMLVDGATGKLLPNEAYWTNIARSPTTKAHRMMACPPLHGACGLMQRVGSVDTKPDTAWCCAGLLFGRSACPPAVCACAFWRLPFIWSYSRRAPPVRSAFRTANQRLPHR